MKNIIEIKNLNFRYTSKHPVINDLNLTIKRGEYISILGHNGSGKSTLAKLIVGLLEAESGDIFIDGKLLSEEFIDEIREKVGIVFQNPDNQFVGITVKDDIAFGLENRRIERTKMLDLIDEFSALVRMDKFLEKNPEELSGGEKQRVAIAGVLACKPDIIILDEATSMLDPKGIKEVNEVIDELKGTKTIISITHNLIEAINADRVLVMNEGRIILDGTPLEVFREEETLIESHLDILESMKLLKLIKEGTDINNKEGIENLLWELTFKK